MNDSSIEQDPNDGAKGFYQLLHELKTPLYDGHKTHTFLSVMTKLLHFKKWHDCSKRGFNELLNIVKEFLPAGDKLLKSYYDLKKLVKRLNLAYEKIDTCENDYMLYYNNENKDKRSCNIYGTSTLKIPRKGKRRAEKDLMLLSYCTEDSTVIYVNTYCRIYEVALNTGHSRRLVDTPNGWA